MATRAEKKAAKAAAEGKDPAEQKERVERPVRKVYEIVYTSPRHLMPTPASGNGEPFATQEAAEAKIAANMPISWQKLTNEGYVFTTREMPWQSRERHDFNTGRYKRPVWVNETFWKMAMRNTNKLAEHFAHVAVKDPTMLAFTPTPEDGERDRQAIMKPGKYLQKFFGAGEKGVIAFGPLKGGSPMLNEREIAYYAEWWDKGSQPSIYVDGELLFAKTPAEIVDVYAKGPRSCMDGRHEKGNAVAVYGAGDIQLAYLKFGDKIRARAICWPDKKAFGRCYPALENYVHEGFKSADDSQLMQTELRARLLQLGWTDIQRKPDALNGARLSKVPLNPSDPNYRPSRFHMPYLDSGVKVTQKGPEPDKFFYMSDVGEFGTSQYGYLHVRETFTCPGCKGIKFKTDDQGRPLTVEVYHSWTKKAGPGGMQLQCHQCARYMPTCGATGVRFTNAMIEYDVHNTPYAKGWMAANGFVKCAWSDRWFKPEKDQIYKTADGKPVSLYAIESREGFVCRHNGVAYPPSEGSLKFCGFPKSMDNDETITPEQRLAGDLTRRVMVWKGGNWYNEAHQPGWDAYLYNWAARVERSARSREAAARRKLYTQVAPSFSLDDEFSIRPPVSTPIAAE